MSILNFTARCYQIMLVEFKEIEDILVCPRSGRPLVRDCEDFKTVSNEEGYDDNRYRAVGGQPVLVDFKKSILCEQDVFSSKGSSAICRNENSIKTLLKNLFLRREAGKKASAKADDFVHLLKAKNKNPLVLVIGGGSKGLGTDTLYDDPAVRLISFDIYASSITHFIADTHRIPLETNSIDGVWVQYVLEHVLDPWQVVSEIHRILHKGGLVYSETPFTQQVHEGAYDFTRFTHSGHRWLFRRFSELDSGVSMGPGVGLLWTVENLARSLFRSRKVGQVVKLGFFWLQFVEKLMPDSYKIDSASSTYFLGQKDEQMFQPKDIVKYYKGAL